MSNTDTMESYRVALSPVPYDPFVAPAHTYIVMADDERDATFYAGVCAALELGAAAAELIVVGIQSQTEFAAESGDDTDLLLAGPEPRRRAHVRVGLGPVSFIASEVRGLLSTNYAVTGCVVNQDVPGSALVLVIEGHDTEYCTLARIMDRLDACRYTVHEVDARNEDYAAVMPTEPALGHKYIHESGDCSCF